MPKSQKKRRSEKSKRKPDEDSADKAILEQEIADDVFSEDAVMVSEADRDSDGEEDLKGFEQATLDLEETGEKLMARLEALQPGRVVAMGSEPQEIQEVKVDDHADVSDDRAVIISTVKNLENQIDAAFELNEVLETNLAETRDKLSKELAARVELDGELLSLKEEVSVVDKLREDIFLADEERNRFADLLEEIRTQLNKVTEERNSLKEKTGAAEERLKEFEKAKVVSDAQVINLREKVVDMEHLRSEFAEAGRIREILDKQVQDLSSRLENSDKTRNSLKVESDTAKEVARSLREDTQQLRERLSVSNEEASDLRIQIEEQLAASRDLKEARTVLESEVKLLSLKNEAAISELDTAKKALREIRSETTRTTGRIRKRYLEQREKE